MEVKTEGGASADATAVTTPLAAAAAVVLSPISTPTSGSKTLTTGAQSLAGMNSAFAKTLALVCPPIQYPPHCRFNPVQQDAADAMELEARLEELFLHAKQLELLFLGNESAASQQQSELEAEVVNLESELNEKHDLIEKYMDVIRGWEGKFKRLEARCALERE